jgi:acetoin utilization protein AcuB
MLVRDCMTPNPTTIDPEATLDAALGLMRALRVRHLPVLSGAALVGILTRTDLMRAVPPATASSGSAEYPTLLVKVHVEEVMTPQPVTTTPDTPVEIAARVLRERKIGSLPVVEERMLVGIVTESDIFDALMHLLGGDFRGVRMAVELPNGLGDLGTLVQTLSPLLEREKGALTVTARLDATSRRGYVRVSTGSPLVVAESLAVAGLEVSHLHFEPPGKRTRAAV